jgi:hypothetical protein
MAINFHQLPLLEFAMNRHFFVLTTIGLLLSLTGCGSNPVAVTGTVSLDGNPLPEGTIAFFDEAGGAPEQFPIKAGKFEGKVLPGKKKVEIRAFKMGEPTKMDDKIIEASPVNYLPPRYNTESQLKAEVTSSGVEPNSFKLDSK